MSENSAKINLKIGQIEISIEGPSEFVSNQFDKIETHLKTYSEMSTKIISPKIDTPVEEQSSSDEQNSNENSKPQTSEENRLPDSFGEWLNFIPRETSDTDKAILAGYFTQITSATKTFRARDVSKLLKEHSIKLSNPSQFLKTSVDTKKIFQNSKTGSEANYKLTRDTEENIVKLLKK